MPNVAGGVLGLAAHANTCQCGPNRAWPFGPETLNAALSPPEQSEPSEPGLLGPLDPM